MKMAGATPTTHELLASLQEQPADLAPAPKRERKLRRSYLELAAVLHVFDLAELKLSSSVDEAGAAAWLMDDTLPALGWAGSGKRTLRLDARREGLDALGGRGAMKAALGRTAGREQTPVQSLFEAWVETGKLRLEELTARELSAALTLCDWGLPGKAGFPSRAEVESAARQRSLTADFEVLAAQFVGRATELAELHGFLGLSPEVSRGWLPSLFGASQSSQTLVLHGIGGAGKTALVARFVLDYFEGKRGADFPFVYLAFDDRALNPAEPATIIGAVLRQLDMQIEMWLAKRSGDVHRPASNLHAGAMARDATRSALEDFSSRRDRLRGRAVSHVSQGSRLGSLRELDRDLFQTFARLVRAVSEVGVGPNSEALPFLFVLDSFEEVEYLPESDLELFWQMIDLLTDTVPNLRLLIVGRVPPVSAALATRKLRHLPLGDLTREDALQLLGRLGIEDDDAADAIVQHIGCNPLTLHLAARAVAAESNSDDLSSVQTRRFGLFSVGQEVIRGQLYRRILDHIHDPDVRRLAHPGMVLRRVTPEIIANVLAPVCGLGHPSDERARELFDSLGREHSLVRLDGSGALIYREELREPMLRVLTADRPEEAERLHLAAAEYYRKRTDPIEQIEFIYHVLMLPNPNFAELERRWTSSTGQRLAGAIDEIPVENRSWLASMMRIRLSGGEARHASEEERVRILWSEAVRVFRLGDFERANAMLAGERLTPDSPLTVLSIRALMALGRYGEASTQLEDAIVGYPAYGGKAPIAELLWLQAQLRLASGDKDKALAALRKLLPIALRFASALPAVQTLAEIIPLADPMRAAGYREQMARALAALEPADLYNEPSLVRLALVRLGPVHSAIWMRLLPEIVHGLPVQLAERSEEERAALRETLAELFELAGPDSPAGPLRHISQASFGPQVINDILFLLIKSLPPGSENSVVLRALWEMLRAEGASLAASTLAGLNRDRRYVEGDGAALA